VNDELPKSDPRKPGFTPEVLDKTVISIPLLHQLDDAKKGPLHAVVIDLNLDFVDGRAAARRETIRLIDEAKAKVGQDRKQGVNVTKSKLSEQYVFATLEAKVIREAVRQNTGGAIYRIWPDFEVHPLIFKSVSTVKADAARAAFTAMGDDIVWAVLDSGIQKNHPHFQKHKNLDLDPALAAKDFTGTGRPHADAFGHGTHVAGIIAGELSGADGVEPRAFSRMRDENGDVRFDSVDLEHIAGMAPRCKLLSLKVLDGQGAGVASNLITALEYVQRLNGYGRRLRVHGVNLSVGYDFEPEWFACGQSPLCVEVDRLVRSGVVVVVAAGNTGYGWLQGTSRGTVAAGLDLTINDPGNAALAITVGATHRDEPHTYGVSYFSSKGPTGDGRLKPDLVAPGEKILSCAAGAKRNEAVAQAGTCNYVEDSGTSMAAPHVSGVIAAFLSIRREFIGRPDRVKDIFLSTATDLGRDRNFQGQGLVDLMRAIQSV
jgi:subtilisin family serine protease